VIREDYTAGPAALNIAGMARSQREFGLDWLRVIAFGILILYHTGMFFVPWDWHIKNPEQSEGLTHVMIFFNRWRLPLLFFISGAGVYFSLRRRSYGRFAAERVQRLLVPLVFGILVVVPPQIYFERLHRGQFSGSYLEFWPSVLQGVSYPKGNTSWHHLWFVAYILVYSLICLPLFAAFRSEAGRRAIDALTRFAARPGAIYLVNLPNIAVALWLGPRWPTTHNLTSDWANFTGSLLTFLWGFVICGNPRFLDLITRKRVEFLSAAVVMTVVFYGVRLSGADASWSPTTRLIAWVLVNSYFGLGWIFTLIGYSRTYLNRDSPLLRYATEAVYPFYIAHQTVTITIAYFMIPWNAPIAVKLPLLAAGTFLGSWIVFELSRRNFVTSALMGIRPRRS